MTEDDYISFHISPEPEILRRLYRQTHLGRLYPRMCTGHIQGRVLVMLTRMIAPRRILELGTFTGYSALCFAEGMPSGCAVDTVEVDDEYADDLRDLFDTVDAEINLHIGDAEEVVPRLLRQHTYDMVFVDANKRRYPQYFQLLADALPSGAYILADNTLWTDKVLDPDAHDPQTEGIRTFNDMVVADPRFEVAMLPVRDGLSIIRKK